MKNEKTRRDILLSGAQSAAAALVGSAVLRAAPQAESDFGRVKITGVKTTTLMLKYPIHLVKVETDAGLYGIGEAYGRDAGIPEIISSLERLILGEDPLQVDYLFQKMYEAKISRGSWSGMNPGAISGVETALWDVAGKILNVPVYILLGGRFRDKILVYLDTGSPKTADPAAWADVAEQAVDLGFRALKFDTDRESRWQTLTGSGAPYRYRGEIWNRAISPVEMEQWIKILEAARERLGDRFPLAVDMHYNYNASDAAQFVAMAEDLKLWFIEDPTPPENADALARICRESRTPICTGENLSTRHTFRDFIEKQACDIIQPDPQKAGGLLETKKIADWADLYYIPMACHNLCSPVGTVANAHVCAAVRSFAALETDTVDTPPFWQDLIQRDGPFYRDGYYHLTGKPGLGIELNEEVCRAHLASGAAWF